MGQAFENLIDYTNRIYQNKGMALINKRPTPVKVLRTRGNHIFNAVYDKKSTVDYDGFYKGYGIAFEAKSTKLTRLPLDMIAEHQIKYLEAAKDHGAITFLIANMRDINKTFVLPSELIFEYVDNAQQGGRKSLPMDDIKKRGIEVSSGNGVPLDYLEAVEKLIKKER